MNNHPEAGSTAVHRALVGDSTEEFLTFVVDDQHCGVDILRVQEIRGWEAVTRIPNAPPHVQGVLNLRGAIVPIIDLRMRFGMEAVEYGKKTVIVVLQILSERGSRTTGIVVDAVSDVCNLSQDNVQEAPDFGDQVDTRFLRGMATHDDKLVLILDIDRLIGTDANCLDAELTA